MFKIGTAQIRANKRTAAQARTGKVDFAQRCTVECCAIEERIDRGTTVKDGFAKVDAAADASRQIGVSDVGTAQRFTGGNLLHPQHKLRTDFVFVALAVDLIDAQRQTAHRQKLPVSFAISGVEKQLVLRNRGRKFLALKRRSRRCQAFDELRVHLPRSARLVGKRKVNQPWLDPRIGRGFQRLGARLVDPGTVWAPRSGIKAHSWLDVIDPLRRRHRNSVGRRRNPRWITPVRAPFVFPGRFPVVAVTGNAALDHPLVNAGVNLFFDERNVARFVDLD